MIVYIHGAKCLGIEAVPVTVEVNITLGVGIHLVGLADAAVKESLLRTVTAGDSTFPERKSSSTWPRPTCTNRAAATTSLSPWA